MGTFIAFCIGAVLWIEHRHVQKINKAREEQSRKDLHSTLDRLGATKSQVITIARIEIKDERIW